MKARFIRNNIVGLITSRGVIEKVGYVKTKIKNHFELRFTKSNDLRPTLKGVDFGHLAVEDKAFLEASFALEKVKDVIWRGISSTVSESNVNTRK